MIRCRMRASLRRAGKSAGGFVRERPATDIAEGNGWRHEGRDVAAALGRNSSRA
ncbi:hypothetical protein SS05631_b61980 (plasmid) [Sinorhizobium sp. CCBAU 05631]|nr:hypothetical protein SS05631_b61980 [Sinorhizobium sp. CCBAU 05631]